jgi:hypothetical protein
MTRLAIGLGAKQAHSRGDIRRVGVVRARANDARDYRREQKNSTHDGRAQSILPV